MMSHTPTNTGKNKSSSEVTINLVDGKASTTSLDVANHFGKRHDDVLKRIRNLDCPADFTLRNFAECSRNGANNKPEPYFRMTRDGFTLLCMGFTGKQAMHWKVAYILAFNKMEQVLLEQPRAPDHGELVQFAMKTLELMRNRTPDQPPRPATEQVVRNYLALESLEQATPEQLKQALSFLQGQIIGEGAAAQSLPGVAGSTIAKDMLYSTLRSAHDTEMLFNALYDQGAEWLMSEHFKNHMANQLAETSKHARELLGYVSSHATRNPFSYKQTC